MALNGSIHVDSAFRVLMPVTVVAAATSLVAIGLNAAGSPASGPISRLGGAKYIAIQASFLYGAGGTTAKAFVQTSLDGGLSWFDIACAAFTTAAAVKVFAITADIAPATQGFTPGAGALADNTIIQGVLGDRFRVSYVTTGTYTGTTSLAVYAHIKG